MKTQDIQAIQLLLSTPKKIAIIPHRGPDGDAMGSTLGLYHFLLKSNHQPVVIAPNEFPDFLAWLPGSEKVKIFEQDKLNCTKILEESELKKLKKDDLVALCEERSCLAKGTKAVLIEQLLSTNPEPVELLPLPSEAEILEIVEKLEGVNLAQRTPERVAHRREDLVRRRKVIETNNPSVETLENGNVAVEFTLRCESGTYVKETIHGDDGRTQPSMASLIKAKCTVEWLDVGDIHAD